MNQKLSKFLEGLNFRSLQLLVGARDLRPL
jgi:hypothetical protein